jgi:hypothetical protein
MASNEIKIIINGDASGLQKTAGQVTTAFDKQIIPKTKAAGAAILDFSRIIQDAPFAANNFGSIANNIDPAFLSVQRLREEAARLSAETGKNVTAFSLFRNALMGGAGIGLAISTVTSLITAAQMKYGSLGNAINALFGGYDGLTRANQELAKSFSEATGKAADESAVINSLVGIARNETLSKEARGEAINKLNKEYDEFLPKLTLENINTQQVTDSVNKLNEALLRQAKIKGVQDLIAKEFERLTLVMTDLGENVDFFDVLKSSFTGVGSSVKTGSDLAARAFKNQGEAADDAKKRIELFNKVLNDLLTTEATEGTLFAETQKKGADALKARLDALEKIKKVTEETAKNKFQFGAQQSVEQATQDLIELEKRIGELKLQIGIRDAKAAKVPKNEIDELAKAIKADTEKNVNDLLKAQKLILQIRSELRVELAPIPSGEIESAIAKATGFDKKIPIKSDRQVRIEILGLELVLAEEEAKKAVERLRDTIVNGAVDAFSTVGNSFGELLSGAFSGAGIGEAFSKAGQSLLSGIGGVLQEIGKQIIATSALIKALKESLKTLIANPVAGIAVGLGLVALGGLLKNIKFPAFAGGVENFGGGFAIVGERGPELVRLPRGSDVIPNHMLGAGGDTSVTLMPSIRFSLTSFQIGLERVENKRRRLG